VAVYAIGDVQGCYDALRRLLDDLDFDPGRDRLWLAGDLVNRGPQSLEVLRFVRGLGEAAVSVLGNHDLNLLAVAHGERARKRKDTLEPVLTAPDRDDLLDWLRHRPLLHHDPSLNYTLVHAGLPPQWGLAEARDRAAELEAVLRGERFADLLHHMYGNTPDRWCQGLAGWERLRFITNCFTRMRYVSPCGRLELRSSGPPGTQPHPYLPWFQVPGRASAGLRIVFGHWSTLGPLTRNGVYALDSGCIWGGALTALRLTDAPRLFQYPCPKGLYAGD
jgi:bis(5'-nucleosyl)-tetraphosphatase (symmetrical)